jgi:hypothetical protein
MTQKEILRYRLNSRERIEITNKKTKKIATYCFFIVTSILLTPLLIGYYMSNLFLWAIIDSCILSIWFYFAKRTLTLFSSAALHGDTLTLKVIGGKNRITSVRSIREMHSFNVLGRFNLTYLHYTLDGEKVKILLMHRNDDKMTIDSGEAIRMAQRLAS